MNEDRQGLKPSPKRRRLVRIVACSNCGFINPPGSGHRTYCLYCESKIAIVQVQKSYDELLMAAALLPDTADITYPSYLSHETVVVERINSRGAEFPLSVPSKRRTIRIWKHRLSKTHSDGMIRSVYAFSIHRDREVNHIFKSSHPEVFITIPMGNSPDGEAPPGYLYDSPTAAGWVAVNYIFDVVPEILRWRS